jgi:membrane protein implicated in regulation of membrane protease activity
VDSWLIWLAGAVALGLAEILSLTGALGILAGAALVTSGLAAAGLPLPVQLVAFTVVSTASVALARPLIIRLLRQPRSERFGVDALIGKPAHVIDEVSGHGGKVRIGGEEWTARAYDESLVIPAGTTADVMEISGSTALVYPREEPWKSQPR